MVLLLNSKTRGVKAFSIKFLSCPVRAHESNKNYAFLMKKIKARLEIFRQRAVLKLDIFTGEPISEIGPKKKKEKEKKLKH